MGNLERLTGSPWHVEKMTRQEGDEKRHKSRCINYKGKESNQCRIFGGRCHGSAHCSYYREIQSNHTMDSSKKKTEDLTNSQSGTKKKADIFHGVKYLKLDEVYITKAFKSVQPKQSKIENVEKYFKQHGRLDKPIIVTINNNKYYIEDGYLRYIVARDNGMKDIPCEMGNSEDVKLYKRLRTIDTLVWIKRSNEVGKVIDYNLEQVKIELDSGKTVLYDIHKAVETKSIRIL